MQNLRKKRNEKGQGLVEYILIVALMGIVAIGVINKLSTETQSGFTKATKQLNTEFRKI